MTSHTALNENEATSSKPTETSITIGEVCKKFTGHYKSILGGSLAAGLTALGITYLIPPTYTATAILIPPQQQGSAALALSSLGALAGLAGSSSALKNPAEQYVSMLQSSAVKNKIVDKFKLMEVYDVEYKEDARKELSENVRITLGRKDGLISIEVEDRSPKRSAEIANTHIEALRELTEQLALSEAQQRRQFFENQLEKTKANLIVAQTALQESGFTEGALNADPRAAAERYAALSAQITSATVELQLLRSIQSDQSPEVMQRQSTLRELNSLRQRFETPPTKSTTADYISKYRNFKYHEALFEMLAKQYEGAKVDEAREGALIQVIEEASPPERKSKPKRGTISALTSTITFAILAIFYLVAPNGKRKISPNA